MSIARWVRPLGWASLVANVVIVVTGGAVRLTGSGLGCPTWPRCTDDSLTPHGAFDMHTTIEFTNRMLTFALTAVAIATFVAAWQTRRRSLRVLALVLALGIPAQAVVGGISVLTDLNSWVVSLHLLLSMAMIGVAVLFLRREAEADDSPDVWVRGVLPSFAWVTFAAGWAVLYVGTVVTGAGPHAGDAETERNGLDPLQVSQVHADLVILFIGLTVGLLLATSLTGRSTRPVVLLLAVEVGQGAIGFVQYFTDLPELLVGFHLLGAAVTSAALTWAVLHHVLGAPDRPNRDSRAV